VRRRFWVFAVLLVVAALLAPPVAVAQDDDWSLTREPARRRPSAGGEGRPRGLRPTGARRRSPADERSSVRSSAHSSEHTELWIDRYLQALEREPTDEFALDRLVELYRGRDGSTEALEDRLAARLADPAAYAPRMILGHLARRRGRLEEARALYEEAASLRASDPLPRLALARVARDCGDAAGARARLLEALQRTRDGAAREDVLRQLAGLAIEHGDLDEARRRYDELAAGAHGSLYLRTEFARALLERGRTEQAIEEYQRVARALRGDRRALAPVLVDLARAELAAGRDAAAIGTLDRAIAVAAGASGLRAEAHELLLEAYRRAGRLEELAARLVRGGARGFEGAMLLARIHDELGHDDEALAGYRRALAQRPRDVDVRLRITQVLARAGRLEELAAEYRALIRQAPGEPRWVVELATLVDHMGRRGEAIAMLDEILRRSRDPALHERVAHLWAEWGEAARAEAALDRLTRLDPRDPIHLVALGSQRFEAGDRAGAIATWRRILSLPGERAVAYATLGGILADHDLLTEAIEAYAEAVRLAPASIDAVRGLATVLERAERDEEAEAYWRRVIELAGDDRAARREARERIAGIWSRSRRLEAEVRQLATAFAADPPDLEAGRLLAEAHRRGRNLAAAERVLQRLAELDPRDADTLLALERVRTQAGDLMGAIEVLRRLVDADPRRAAQYLSRMAEHALSLYRDEEALAYAAEAVARNPDDATAHRRLGELQRARQDISAAIASYRRALELDDRLWQTAFELAEMHLARGETWEADRIYRRVLVRAPDDDLVARAARAAMQIHLGAGTLEELEREILPLALAHPDRPIYRRIVVEIDDALTAPLLVRARRAGPEGEAARAQLRRLGARALKPMLEALRDQDPAQRRTALAVLGFLGNPAAAGPLLALAESESADLESRVLALLGAGAIAEADLAPRLQALSRRPEPRIRAAASYALARLALVGPSAAAVAALRARLEDEDPEVRAWAALGLGLAGERSVSGRLRAMLGESHPGAQASAALALGWLGDRSAVPALLWLAREGEGVPAEAALTALAGEDDDDARAALVAALFEPDPRRRRAAATALRRGVPRPERLAPPISGEAVAAYVARLIEPEGALPPPELASLAAPIERALSDLLAGPPARAQTALRVLAGEPGPIGLGELTRDFAAWPEAARAAASEALVALAHALRDAIAGAAVSPDAAVRADAVRVLARVDDPQAAALVAAALEDEAAAVRRAALDALAAGASAAPEAAERLAALLSGHREWAMRTRAARALGRIGGRAALPALAAALAGDAFAFVREEAARALAEVGGSAALAALRGACSDPEARVREAVAAGLAAAGERCP
jgi:tetratricopeptide (TPR) repeat protein/HEAT repeat protein